MAIEDSRHVLWRGWGVDGIPLDGALDGGRLAPMDFPVTGTWLARTTGLPDGLCTNVVKAAESELGSLNLNLGRHFVQKVQNETQLRREIWRKRSTLKGKFGPFEMASRRGRDRLLRRQS